MADDDEEWISAQEAAQLCARKFDGLTAARYAISLGLREAVLRAAVESCALLEGHEDDADFVEQQDPGGDLLEVPPDAWLASDNWDSDRLAWDWLNGEFEVKGDELGVHYFFHGVHFLKNEIETLDAKRSPFAPATAAQETAASKRGPKPQTQKWGALIEALLKLDRNNELNVTDFDDVGDLLDRVQREISHEELMLSDRTIDGVLGYVWEHCLAGRPPRN